MKSLMKSFVAFGFFSLGILPFLSATETEEAEVITHYPAPNGAFKELHAGHMAVLGYDRGVSSPAVTIGTTQPAAGKRLSVTGDAKITGGLQVVPTPGAGGVQQGYVLTSDDAYNAVWKPGASGHAWLNPEQPVFSLSNATPPPLPAENAWLTITNPVLDLYPARMAILKIHTTAANVDIRAVGSRTNNPGDPSGTPPDPPVNFADHYKTHWSTTVTRSKTGEDDWNTALVMLDEHGDFQLVYHTDGNFSITIWVLGVL